MCHWLSAVSYVYLLLTGLALFTLFVLDWPMYSAVAPRAFLASLGWPGLLRHSDVDALHVEFQMKVY